MKSPVLRRSSFSLVLVLLVLFGIVTAYYRAFSGMANYDDEGTMISWVRQTFSGQPLYDRVVTPYGPLYFAYEWLAHVPMGIPISNDSVRFVTVFFWVLAVVLVFLLSYKLTASLLVSWGAAILAFGELGFLSYEPAHPQELCIVLLLALALAACFTGNHIRLMLIMGALTAAMMLTKINIGIFGVAALAVAMIYSTNRTLLWSAARGIAIFAALALPVALMSGLFPQPWVVRFCALVTLSLAAALAAASRIDSNVRLGIRDFVAAVLGFTASLALISSFALARGSSIAGMIDSLILGPRKFFGPAWFMDAPIATWGIYWSILCVLLAWGAVTGRSKADFVALLKLAFAGIVVAGCVTGHRAALMNLTPPLLWLIVIPTDAATPDPAGKFSRIVLLLISVFQFLYAFPVAGSQVPFTEICPIVVAAVCFADALRQIEVHLPLTRVPAFRRIVTVAASLILLSVCGVTSWRAVRLYHSEAPLHLRGATRIHLPSDVARALHEMVGLTQANACSTLVTLPGMLSFDTWTGLHSPSGLKGGNWAIAMDDTSQESVARQLSVDAHACVILNTDRVKLWDTRPGALSGPMLQFIRDNFRAELDSAPYVFLVRR